MKASTQAEPGISGKVALVTGAAGGIGTAVAAALAAAGARVAATDADTGALQEVTGQLATAGHAVTPYKMDVTDERAVESVVAQVEDEAGPVGLLVNAAGILRTGPLTGMSDEDWAATFAVNVTGVFRVMRAVGSRMRDRGSGAIVTVSSNAAATPRLDMGAYCASKAASKALTECLGLELAAYGVRCNVIAPGSTDTPMLRSMWAGDYGPDSVISGDSGRYRVGIPLRKLAQSRDIADAAVFLLSDRASHITMQVLCVDGGASLAAC